MKKLNLLIALFFIVTKIHSQNDCSNALVVDEGYYPIIQFNGTGAPPYFCIDDFGFSTNYEWYLYSPMVNGSLTVTTDFAANEGRDTRFNIYKGTCGALQCVGGADDGGTNFSYLAEKTVNVEAGTNYYIVFDNSWSGLAFTFEIIAGETIVVPLEFETISLSSSNYTMCIADMNGDFLDDVVSASGTEGIVNINYQMEDGTFENQIFTIGTFNDGYWSMAAGDFDNNGYTDLLTAGGAISILLANADATDYSVAFSSDYIFCQRSNCVDINGDGNLDAFVCHDVEPNVYFINDGLGNYQFNQGGLSDVPDGGNYGSVWIDYDNDCDMDLFIAKCRGGDSPANINQLFRNDGDGVFVEVSEESGLADDVQTWSSAWGDFDNDGDMDVAVGMSSDANGGHKLMVNNGDGTFTDVTANSGWDTFAGMGIEYAPGDFDNDGYVDVFGGNSTFMMNNGDMTFTAFQSDFYSGPIGDLNNDGFLDIISYTGFNEAAGKINKGNNNHHVTIGLKGVESNASAIGARVTVYTPSFTQIRDIRSGEGFRHMSSLNAHFGFGADSTIQKITICWPSGNTEELLNPPIDGVIKLVEGSVVGGLVDSEKSILEVYPSPARNTLSFKFPVVQEKVYVSVFDLSGKMVLVSLIENNNLDISRLQSGFYTLKVELNGKLFQSKFIVE